MNLVRMLREQAVGWVSILPLYRVFILSAFQIIFKRLRCVRLDTLGGRRLAEKVRDSGCAGPEIAYVAAMIDRELIVSGGRLGENDTWIAGFCRYYGQPVISRDQAVDHVHGLRRLAY